MFFGKFPSFTCCSPLPNDPFVHNSNVQFFWFCCFWAFFWKLFKALANTYSWMAAVCSGVASLLHASTIWGMVGSGSDGRVCKTFFTFWVSINHSQLFQYSFLHLVLGDLSIDGQYKLVQKSRRAQWGLAWCLKNLVVACLLLELALGLSWLHPWFH